jgi:hypothetical protein
MDADESIFEEPGVSAPAKSSAAAAPAAGAGELEPEDEIPF